MTFSNVTLLALFVALPRMLLAQMFYGQLADNRTFKPLSYATIDIKGKSIGGQTNQNGTFQIDLSEAISTDTILISHLGYKPKSLLKHEIMDAHYDIKLSPTAYQWTEQVNHTKLEPLNVDLPTTRGEITSQRDYSKSSGWLQNLAIKPDGTPLKSAKSVMRLTIWESDSLRVSVLTLSLSDHQSVEVSAIPENSFFISDKEQKQGCVTVMPNKLIINPNCKVTIEWVEPDSNQHRR